MEQFRVKRFEGAFTDWDETDAERGSLRHVRGLVFGHLGALSSMPVALDGGDLYAAANGLGLEAPSLLLAAAGGTSYVVSFDPNLGPGEQFTFIAPVSQSPAGTIPTTNGIVSVSLLETGFDEARWFGTRCGEYLIIGNGIDDNKVYECRTGTYRDLGYIGGTVGSYDKSRVPIPPCTSFAVSQAGVLFAAGNPDNPNRVWVTDQPDVKTPVLIERVRSLSFAFIDVGLATNGSTAVTGLSVVRDYVLAHIYNDRPVLLYSFDTNGALGWRCRQVNTELAVSAPNPGCATDTRGDSSYFLGTDCEVYRDSSVAPAASGENVARAIKVITARGAGTWNEDIDRTSPDLRMVFHEREGLIFILAALKTLSTKALYAVNTSTLSYSGPIRLGASAICVTDDALVAIVDGKIRVYEPAALGAVDFPAVDSGVIADAQPVSVNPGIPVGTLEPVVGVNTTALTFNECSGLFGVWAVSTPFGKMEPGTIHYEDTVAFANEPTGINQWFANATLGFFETGYEDFGDPASFKDFLELHLTLRRNSLCAIGIVAETEGGVVRKNWRGVVSGTETLKAFFNMKGRRVRFRVYVVTFGAAPCAVLDYTIGWLPGVAK